MAVSDKARDLGIAFATVAMAVGYLAAIPYQVAADHDGVEIVSGRTLPYLIGTLLLLLGVLLGASAARRGSRPAAVVVDAPSPPSPPSPPSAGHRLGRAAVYAGAMVAYAVGIEQVGYVVSTAIVLPFAMVFSGVRNPWVLVLVTLAVPPLLYVFFHRLMQIPLPDGALLF